MVPVSISQVFWREHSEPSRRFPSWLRLFDVSKGKLPPNKKNIVYKPFVFLHQRQFVFALLPVEPASKKHQVTYIARGLVLVAGCCPLASPQSTAVFNEKLAQLILEYSDCVFSTERSLLLCCLSPSWRQNTTWVLTKKKKCCCCSIKSQLAGHHLRQRFFKLSFQFPLPAFCHDLRDNDLFPQHSDRLNTSNLMRWIVGISDLEQCWGEEGGGVGGTARAWLLRHLMAMGTYSCLNNLVWFKCLDFGCL